MEYLLRGGEVDDFRMQEYFGPLLQFSLISEEISIPIFSCLRLIQLSVKSWLQQKARLNNSNRLV